MEILIDNRQKRIDIDPDDLRKKTERILEDLGCKASVILSLALVDAAAMSDLNYRYRGKNEPTNVLSFSQTEGEHPGLQPDLIGDVVICTDRSADDAAVLGYTDSEMILYLLIHGILHLVGYDHSHPIEAEVMQAQVDRIFREMTELA
ncbi:MAG: rRNA maturation RNase YbeY [Desulfomonilaceae bacterium]